jgi:hypothetical protein
MRIRVLRTGGFAGIAMNADVETGQLEPSERDAVERLVEESDFFILPAVIEAPPGGYDRFQYEITIEREGQNHTLTGGDAGMSEALSELAHLVLRLGR